MTTSAGKDDAGPRSRPRRSSAETRSRLLAAAGELFSERGYERTTVRDIGQLADVDPALIARHFGSKAALYLEALRPGGRPAKVAPLDVSDPAAIQQFLDWVGPHSPTPTLDAAIRPYHDQQLQAAAVDVLNRRILKPTYDRATAAGLDSPDLRTEIVGAALAGILLSRTSKALPTLADASTAEVAPLVAQLLGSLLTEGAQTLGGGVR